MTLLASARHWLAWTGMETDLIFNKGVALPSFAAFPLIDSPEGRDLLTRYYAALIALGADTGTGLLLDTPTWMANPDRAAGVGYSPEDLPRVTREAVSLAARIAGAHPEAAVRISVQIGPRGDGYQPGIAAAKTSADYHRPQILAARDAGADLVSAYTMGSLGEALGIARAAEGTSIAALLSFTIETDGRLPDGTALAEAVSTLAAEAQPAAIMVNCAHPDHVARALDGGAWQDHLTGIVANASRKSHAELDACEVLDDGNPVELADQLAALRSHLPLRIFGGCCGTDLRHLRAIGERLRSDP